MSNSKKLIVATITGFVLIGCGGGAGDADNGGIASMSSLTGTVPGTLIEAFCKNGSYYKTNSIQNGTSAHPFFLSLPRNLECKIVMTTNENDPDLTKRIITPIEFVDANGVSTYIALDGDTDLGNVPLSMSGGGVQAPMQVDINNVNAHTATVANDPLDTDNDGIPNIYEDTDGDGLVNQYDNDDDGDGIPDTQDADYSNDTDGDGVDNDHDSDDNNDGTGDTNGGSSGGTTGNVTLPSQYTANSGKVLGSQCAQCHGTNGISSTSWDSIAGEGEFATEGFGGHPIMKAIADGYTASEKSAIDSWSNSLPRR